MTKRNVWGLCLAVALTSCASQPSDGPAAPLPAAADSSAEAHVARAKQLAGTDLTQPLVLCKTVAEAREVVLARLKSGGNAVIPPTKLFDNLYFVGNQFVGVFVLKTSAGLILFDSLSSTNDVKTVLEPGLAQLGLDPHQIRDVVVTHGHYDHFGGAAYLQQTYGAHVLLGAADWRFIEQEKRSPGVEGGEVPKHDVEVSDGQILSLGDTSVTLHLTPGHTPGTVSAIVPAIEQGKSYKLALFGSVLFPPNREPTPANGGLALYERSVQHFDTVSNEAKVDGILNTHTFIDGTAARLEQARNRKAGEPNPFLIGTANAHRYHEILHECVAAALARGDQPAPVAQAQN
ncbi:MAG TPA: MBL fold metallo-hydrolase [Polyangiaceae bacterium]|nr:MBL fold metallo-hydrolase [Polyangiaceae bacterium]